MGVVDLGADPRQLTPPTPDPTPEAADQAAGWFAPSDALRTVRWFATVVVVAAAALGVAGPAFAAPTGFSAETIAGNDQGMKVDLTAGTSVAQPNPTGIPPITRDEKFSPSGTLFGINENAGQLITINTTTGVGTIVGVNGLGGSGADRLAFTGDGRLWMAAGTSFYSINLSTGAARLS